MDFNGNKVISLSCEEDDLFVFHWDLKTHVKWFDIFRLRHKSSPIEAAETEMAIICWQNDGNLLQFIYCQMD